MNDREIIQGSFQETVSREISLMPEGHDRFQVLTPFRFDDGDHFVIVLKRHDNGWALSDEGHTFMHLSYRMNIKDLEKGTRARIIADTLANFGMEDEGGVLTARLDVHTGGDALYGFLQGLSKIADVTYLSREIVRSTFFDDFRELMMKSAPPERLTFNYNIPHLDAEAKYPVDCRLNGMQRPLFIFAINNDERCKDVTINLHQYESWGVEFNSLAVFEDQEEITRRVLARFSDVSGKQFSSLYTNRDRIQKFLGEVVELTS